MSEAKRVYEFGPFRVDPVERLLLRGGTHIPLAPKVFDTLLYLVSNSGHVLGKDAMMKAIWPDTFVEEASLAQTISMLRKALGETAGERQFIETIPCRGYRFVAVVNDGTKVVEDHAEGDAPIRAHAKEPLPVWLNAQLPRRRAGALAAFAILVSLAAYWGIRPGDSAVRSIAVLPFNNASKFEQEDVLSESIAETLVAHLAKIADLKVISFSKTRQYKAASVHAGELGRQLGVNAVIEGSLRRDADRLRIVVHLVEAGSGVELWGDDISAGAFRDPLEIQEQLAEDVARRLRTRLTAGERSRVATVGTSNAEAYELFVRAKQLITRGAPSWVVDGTPAEIEVGCQMLRRALELDPNFPEAHAWLAYGISRINARGKLPWATEGLARASADRALALAPQSPVAQMAVLSVRGQMGGLQKLAAAKHLLDDHPDDLDAIAAAASAYFIVGMLDRAIPLYRKAVQADPSNVVFRSQLARSYLYTSEFQNGVATLTPEIENGDAGKWAMMLYLELAQFVKAMQVAEATIRNRPEDFVGWYFAGCTFATAGRPERARQIWMEGVRKTEEIVARQDDSTTRAFLGIMYAKLGMREQALNQARRALSQHPQLPSVCYFVAKIHAVLEDRGEALRYLKHAVENGFLTLGYMDYHRRPPMGLHNLDTDPGFQAIRDDLARRVDALRAQY